MSLEHAPSPSNSAKHPNAYPFSSDFIPWLKSTIGGEKKRNIIDIFSPKGFSNNLVRLTFDDGRKLIIKQSQYDWAQPRFNSACNASQLVSQQSAIVTPRHINIPEEVVDYPTMAYWYLPYPTLKELWPKLSLGQKKQASRSLGSMLRKMHQIEVPNYGLLQKEHSYCSLSSFMLSELRERLKPAIAAKWPEVLPMLNKMIKIAESLSDRDENAKLVHNDIHLGNILCKKDKDNEEIKCVGLIDWEEAGGGRWEADLASAITLHHPLFFSGKLKGNRLDNFGQCIAEGYGKKPDSKLLRFFRLYHLIDLGFFSAMNEDYQHARHIGKKASGLLDAVA